MTDNNQKSSSESLNHAHVGSVQATTVTIEQSSAESVTAERATITQASVKHLESRSAQLHQSSVFQLQAENAVLTQSAVTFATSDDLRMVNCNALVVRGKASSIEGDLKTVIFAGEATGNVHMIFDKESALRFGAGVGASLVVLGLLARKLFR